MDIEKNNEDSKEDLWNKNSIKTVEINILNNILECKNAYSVEACISFAKLLNILGLTEENYPLFMQFLEIENHWVIDSLIGNNNPFLFFNSINPNNFILQISIKILTKFHPKTIYHKTLSVLLGILEYNYSSPKDGYNLNPLNFTDINNIGKYLNKEKGNDFLNNICIINILNYLGSLEGKTEDPNIEQMARQANSVTSCFDDQKKTMVDIIPHSLLNKSDPVLKEVPPEYIYIN